MGNDCVEIQLPDWNPDDGDLPRSAWTPVVAAGQILSELDGWYCDTFDKQSGQFMVDIFWPLYNKDRDTDEFVDKLLENDDPNHTFQNEIPVITAAMCAQAFRSQYKGAMTEAWSFAIDAHKFWGMHLAGNTGILARANEKTKNAKSAANVRHKENRIARAFVEKEWNDHRVAYEGNKSAFTRDYVKRVFNEFNVSVTEKQMREVWLKDTPHAS